MLNTQMTSDLRGEGQEIGSKETEKREETRLPGKTGLAKLFYKHRCTKSQVWIEAKNDGRSCNSTDSYCSGTRSSLDEGKQENSEEPINPHIEEVRGHFNSKFNNRTPLSLHPPVPMVTDNSRLFPSLEEINPQETNRVVRHFEKIRVERQKTGIEKRFLQREGNETKGEKTIKLAREKNTLPEVISKRRLQETEKQHFLPRLNDKVWSAPPSSRLSIDFDKTFLLGHEDVRGPRTSKRILAWNACVFPATLVDSPVRKRSPLMTSLKRPHKRVKNNMADTARSVSRPAAYTEQSAPLLPRASAGKPLSRLLYPSHHGY